MTAKELIIKELDEAKQINGTIHWWTVLDVMEGYEEHLIDEGYGEREMYVLHQILMDMYVN
jgi:hypothetical protein